MSESISKYYSDRVKRSLDELERLLELAEQVTKDLAAARSNALQQIGYTFLIVILISLFVFSLALFQKNILEIFPNFNLFSLLAGLSVFVIVTIYIVCFIIMSVNRKKWRVEQQIITDILVMSSDILDSLQEQIGTVEYTLTRMRMRRLGLSRDNYFAGIFSS